MRISKTRFWALVIFSAIMGLAGKVVILSDASSKVNVLRYLSLPLLMAISTALFIIYLDKKEVKRKFIILLFSVILIFIVLLIDLLITGMFTLLFYFILLPFLIIIPIIIAIIYGLLIYYNLGKSDPLKKSVKYAIYGMLIGIILLNILELFHYIPGLKSISTLLFGTRSIYYSGAGNPNIIEPIFLRIFVVPGGYFLILGTLIGWIVGKVKSKQQKP